ncbi:POT family-domain-containing protein [Podospora aff. communis PSN243]|uniref:POT family-domain-containing protein n=1 Tax=Podospora aff. communis PSN243 TaxID=3040156 RepID=A0AAV9GK04_9PEZI|nr:POT family-domain-containing protein [Podospora aff. communis PSN243]
MGEENLSKHEPSPPASALTRREATQAEIDSLPHVADKVPFAAWAVILAGAAERFTYFGIISPWQNHMQNPRGNGALPGILGLGQSTAVNVYNAFFLFSFLTPTLFALVADLWLGRFKTLMWGLGLYLVGCVILTTTSLPSAIDSGAGVGGLAASLILIGLGAGAVKATFFALLGDQYVQRKPQLEERKDGKRVIVDGSMTLTLMYNAYYWFTNVASLSSIPVTFLEFHFDFWVAYLLAASALAFCLLLFLLWAGKLVKIVPQGSVLPQAARALTCAARNGFKLERAKQSYQKTHFGRTVPWSDRLVDELGRGLIACRVIFSLVVFYLCISQMYNNLISQAGQVNLSGVPNDMIQAFSGVGCIIFGPILQAMYGVLGRQGINFPPIARMTTGFLFCAAAMAYAAGFQQLIYSTGPCFDQPLACDASSGGTVPNQVSVWVQLPVYALMAIGEIFTYVTAFEYAYNKSPKEIKTVVQALTQLTACVASAFGMAISPVARDPYMVILYSCLAGAMVLTAVLFWWRFGNGGRENAEEYTSTRREVLNWHVL